MDADVVKPAVKTKEVTLPSGAKAVIKPFKGKDIRQAQTIAGDDTSKLMFAIIAVTTELDGKGIVMEDLDEMDGMDVMALFKEFGGNFMPRQNS